METCLLKDGLDKLLTLILYFFPRKVFNVYFSFILSKQECTVPFGILSATEKWNTYDVFLLYNKHLNYKPSRNIWYCQMNWIIMITAAAAFAIKCLISRHGSIQALSIISHFIFSWLRSYQDPKAQKSKQFAQVHTESADLQCRRSHFQSLNTHHYAPAGACPVLAKLATWNNNAMLLLATVSS